MNAIENLFVYVENASKYGNNVDDLFTNTNAGKFSTGCVLITSEEQDSLLREESIDRGRFARIITSSSNYGALY
jgi:hypothetical protein